MVRGPYIDKNGIKKGAWSKEEDDKLRAYVLRYGHWNWRQLPKFAGLQRCGKSCRIRWLNYLNPDVKRGGYSKDEQDLIMNLYQKFGSKWSKIAEHLPGRTDNDIKNHWHTHLKKLQEQKQTPPNHDLKRQTLVGEYSQDDVFEELEAEICTPNNTVNNLSHPVIFESCPFSPSISSSESSYLSSNSATVKVSSEEDESNYKKGAWNQEEDDKLRAYVQRHGLSNGWSEVPKVAGLSRSGKSCRLRWMNYLRPEVKRGSYSKEEEDLIIKLHEQLGNKWSAISAQLPGRSDNEIKNYWNTNLKKRLEFNSQLGEISQSDEFNSNQEHVEDVKVVIDQPTLSPLLENIPLTPETCSSEFSFFSPELDMVNTTTPMEWFMDDNSNPFETFEPDFWTKPFVQDTVGTECGYDVTSSLCWELLSTPISLYD